MSAYERAGGLGPKPKASGASVALAFGRKWNCFRATYAVVHYERMIVRSGFDGGLSNLWFWWIRLARENQISEISHTEDMPFRAFMRTGEVSNWVALGTGRAVRHLRRHNHKASPAVGALGETDGYCVGGNVSGVSEHSWPLHPEMPDCGAGI